MPATEVLFYQGDDERVPVLDWLHALREREERAFRKCFGLIRLLTQSGHELRTRVGNVNYRMLYGFVGKDIALLTAGFTKEKKVPSKEIERAIVRIEKYKANPEAHGFSHGDENEDD